MNDFLLSTIDEAIGGQLSESVYAIDEKTDFFKIGLDSIGFINIIIALERNYNIFIDQDDMALEQFSTIKNIR